MNFKKRLVLNFLIIGVIYLVACSSSNHQVVSSNKEAKKPNMIVILIDDAGYMDFGFMGSKDLLTPELDKLAAAGTIFTDAHVSSTVCSPSRAVTLFI